LVKMQLVACCVQRILAATFGCVTLRFQQVMPLRAVTTTVCQQRAEILLAATMLAG